MHILIIILIHLFVFQDVQLEKIPWETWAPRILMVAMGGQIIWRWRIDVTKRSGNFEKLTEQVEKENKVTRNKFDEAVGDLSAKVVALATDNNKRFFDLERRVTQQEIYNKNHKAGIDQIIDKLDTYDENIKAFYEKYDLKLKK